jgi:hypothetical protein
VKGQGTGQLHGNHDYNQSASKGEIRSSSGRRDENQSLVIFGGGQYLFWILWKCTEFIGVRVLIFLATGVALDERHKAV